MNIIITGGCGYIGSHVAISLEKLGHNITIYDNFSNSSKEQIKRLNLICTSKIDYICADITDIKSLKNIFKDKKIKSVVHMAGLKYVADSESDPISYYENNITGTISLLKAMKECGIKNLVFSSSATVYGEPEYLPIDENHSTSPISVYGRTKLYVENILKDLSLSDPDWSIVCLRYFNPAGAHHSGFVGEEITSKSENLFPSIGKVLLGITPSLKVYGKDYQTHDGTGIRDYIHVLDLSEGHAMSVEYVNNNNGIENINLGRGHGYSVLEVIKSFEKITSRKIPYEFSEYRSGDISSSFADVTKAKQILGWIAKRDLDDMCKSMWYYIENKDSIF